MSNPIRDSLYSYYPVLPQSNPAASRQSSFQQATVQAQQSQISLVTEEGDVVTLSHSQSQAQAITASQGVTPVSFGQSFTLASLDTENVAFSVQGDLSEEEQADIEDLVDDLFDIANDFFNGQMGAAMAGAMNLGDMGSVSELSATFSYVAAVSTQVTNSHPMPALGPSPFSLMEEFHEIAEEDDLPENQYVDLLRGQWEQIEEILDHAQEVREEHEANQPVESHEPLEYQTADDAAHDMVERIKDTIAEHPRLSPFASAFADKAIENALDSKEQKELIKSANQLRKDIRKELSDWLVEI